MLTQADGPAHWLLGWAQVQFGTPREGFQNIRTGYECHAKLGMYAGNTEVLGHATEALLVAGDLPEAERQLDEAFALAHRIQEKAFGRLRESTARKLRKLAEEPAGSPSPVQDAIRPKTGTRYVREYDGKLHEVTVLDFAYEYQGNAYRSLTEIARVITGTKWSGPAFFGLRPELRKAIA